MELAIERDYKKVLESQNFRENGTKTFSVKTAWLNSMKLKFDIEEKRIRRKCKIYGKCQFCPSSSQCQKKFLGNLCLEGKLLMQNEKQSQGKTILI